MADKCWCESAKEDIEKAYKNPNPYHGALQDIMDAEIDYAKMCAICPCRKRRLEHEEEEPAKKRKEVESEEQEFDGPAADNKEADEEDEDSKSEVSLVIAEIDSDEEPEVDDPRDVEEERETIEGWVPGPEPPECCCAEPLAAIKQTCQEWFAYNAERKAILETQREAYKVARANCMTHRYLHFIFISWNFPLF
jgi:hypothetical protein